MDQYQEVCADVVKNYIDLLTLCSNVKGSLNSVVSTTFPEFVRAVSDLTDNVRRKIVTLEAIEKHFLPLIPDPSLEKESQNILEESFKDLIELCCSYPDWAQACALVQLADVRSGINDISQYLRFVASKDILLGIMDCAQYCFVFFLNCLF